MHNDHNNLHKNQFSLQEEYINLWYDQTKLHQGQINIHKESGLKALAKDIVGMN